jgi:hypothetical protein
MASREAAPSSGGVGKPGGDWGEGIQNEYVQQNGVE